MHPYPPVIGIIPARFGSTRFPGKPLALIAGKTLIQRTYENGKRCPFLDDLVVATDDKRIFNHVVDFGGKAVMTSSNPPTGTERIAEVLRDYPEFSSYEGVINLQGDEPFLESEVIGAVVEKLFEGDAPVSTAVVKLTSEEEALNFSINKCVLDKDGNALYFSRTLIPSGHNGEWRPDITYYKHLGIYGYRRDFLMHYASLTPTPLQIAEDLEQLKILEHGYRIKVAIVESESIGIDRPEDINKTKRFL